MNAHRYDLMYHVEDSHWWYRGMEAITRAVIERAISNRRGLRILDAGCGTGAVMNYLADYGTVTGCDYSAEALHYSALRRHARLCRASVAALPFADASFDVVTSFDVLSDAGVADDETPLREFARVLDPAGADGGGGLLLLRLPAYRWLYSAHDTDVATERRYTARAVRAKLRHAGFTIEHVSYANMFLFPVAVLKRTSERFLPAAQATPDLHLEFGALNVPLRWLLRLEAPLVARTGLPFGLTVLALARSGRRAA